MRARELSKPLLALLLIAGSVASASGKVRIFDDAGGQIGEYLAKYEALRASGEVVEIDGLCASACTMVTGVIPRNRICVTPRAVLEFHTAWTPTNTGSHAPSTAGNQILWSNYPADIRNWIGQHGGLGHQIINLGGRELAAMFKSCPQTLPE